MKIISIKVEFNEMQLLGAKAVVTSKKWFQKEEKKEYFCYRLAKYPTNACNRWMDKTTGLAISERLERLLNEASLIQLNMLNILKDNY